MDRYADPAAFLGAAFPGATGYLYYGFHKGDDGWTFREWPRSGLPYTWWGFQQWNESSHPSPGWSAASGRSTCPRCLAHGQRIKIRVSGRRFVTASAYATRVVKRGLNDFAAQIWIPDDPSPDGRGYSKEDQPTHIYEAHIGMAQGRRAWAPAPNSPKCAARIKAGGYNTPVDGHQTSLLRLLRLSSHQLFCPFQSVRHAGGLKGSSTPPTAWRCWC